MLRLSFGCWNYDRTRALMDRSVVPDGIDLIYLNMPVEETFFRMLRHREFDVAEISLSSYVVSCFEEPRPFVAIPVFPSRFFRHSSIYVNAAIGIREPADLKG
jgi:4,5-dihydroxyphthalate decarboxylase